LQSVRIKKWRYEKRIENPGLIDGDCKSPSAQCELLGHISRNVGKGIYLFFGNEEGKLYSVDQYFEI